MTTKQTLSSLKERARIREEQKPALAKQLQERNRHNGSELNAVDKKVQPRARRDARASRQVEKPAQKRRYVQPSSLPAVPDLPGYHCQYVRRDDRERGDYANLRKHLRSGWETVKPSELDDEYLPTIALTKFGDVIGNEDTVLMKLSEELYADRQAQIDSARDARTRAVNGRNVAVDNVHKSIPVYTEENTHEISKPQVRVQAGFR